MGKLGKCSFIHTSYSIYCKFHTFIMRLINIEIS